MSTGGAQLRLLHVISSVDPAGGGPIEALKQLSAIHRHGGHAVQVATLDDPADPGVRSFPHVCHALGPGSRGYGYTPRLVPWLRANASDYDAVIVHGLWQYGSLGTMRALSGTDVPYFVFAHGMLDPWFKRTYRAKHLKKWLYWPWAEYRVLKHARAVLFTCERERALARQSFWLYRCDERVVRFGTAAPPSDDMNAPAQGGVAFHAAFPATRGKRCFLFLGRVHEKKGTDLLLKAYARLLATLGADDREQVHLVMAGPADHAYGVQMVALATRLQLDRHLTWTGMVQGELKWGALHAADAFVLPSHQENFGIAVAEALACAVPALISRQVNIWPEVVNSGAGLADDDTEEGTFALLDTWWRMDPTARAAMRTKAKACFQANFRIEDAAQSLLDTLGACGVGA